jgi:hypothetical protein
MAWEINIPGIFRGRTYRFDNWRLAIADMTGVPLRYVGNLEAGTDDPVWAPRLTPDVRRGDWDDPPEDPLWVLLLVTVPGGVLRARYLRGIAERLHEMQELMYCLDDGRWGLDDIGRRTEAFARSFEAAAGRGEDLVIEDDD